MIDSQTSEKDLRLWTNFKIFSGCSPGDYHHCLYDKYLLEALMKTTPKKWENILVTTRNDTLFLFANKISETNEFF